VWKRYLPQGALVLGMAIAFHFVAIADEANRLAIENEGVRAESPSKNSLTPESMEALHGMIRLQPGEYKWDEIPWYTSIWHARKAAAAEDKPIFVFGTGGAGFNDPLGNC
jgi:hypothetical protein